MTKRSIFPSLATVAALAPALALATAGCGGTSPSQPATAAPGAPAGDAGARFELQYEKYTLDNGLDVILHRDTSDPIVAVATLVHVGSSRERPGRTGFAHFFEHMSFNDSENVPRGSNRKLIGELGGTRNGGTWSDGTIYYEVVPRDAFEKLMWIDSDRLGFMINTVTQWALENEKQVVKNEKRERVDNRPYGHTDYVIRKNLYPADHPYSWTVIGSLADLQSATLDDVREFYDAYYGPGNATLVIAGDIDVAQTRRLVERWFDEIRARREVAPLPPRPVALARSRSLFHEDNFARLPELRITFPTVEQYHRDSYALDALAEILSEGKRAPLYKVIEDEKKLAPASFASHSAYELAGTFTIGVRGNQGVDLDEIAAAVDQALARFERDGFSPSDLERIKVRQEIEFYQGISSVLDKAFQLATYNEFAGDPGFIAEDIARVKRVTREDVMDVYRRYIKGKNHVMTSFVPRGRPELAVTGAVRAEVVEETIVPGAEPEVAVDPSFRYHKTPTRHDRSEPPLGRLPELVVPRAWTQALGNGLSVYGIEHGEVPLVSFRLRIRGGHYLDPLDRSGVASLLAELMIEGTRQKTPEELEDAIALLGATVDIRADSEGLIVTVETLSRNYERVMALIEEILLEPRWDHEEFERLFMRRKEFLVSASSNPETIAEDTCNRLLYGEAHILGKPIHGTLQSVAQITIDDLKRFYGAYLAPNLASLHIAGAIDRERAVAALAGLERRWSEREVELPSYRAPTPPRRPALYFVNVPGAKQSVIRVARLALEGDDPDYFKLQVAQNRLGDGSSARLFQILRIQKGYTYGAHSNVRRLEHMAPFIAGASVRANVTLESLLIFKQELERYRATYTQADLDTTKNLIIKGWVRAFETLPSLLAMLESVSRFGLPLDHVERNQALLRRMTLADVHALIDRYLDESNLIYLVVGDGATQLEHLKKLGYQDPIVLDVEK